MQTITIDVLNDKVLSLLKDLEQLRLIKFRVSETDKPVHGADLLRLQGALHGPSLQQLEGQLDELREAWQ